MKQHFNELSTDYIESYFKDNPQFAGTFTQFNLPKKIAKKFYVILMLPNQNSTNGHFLLVYNVKDKCIFLDPFGVFPCKLIEKFMHTSKNTCYYSNIDVQSINSIACGVYVIHFVNELLLNKPFNKIINEFTDDVNNNDHVLLRYAKAENIQNGGSLIVDKMKDLWYAMKGVRDRFNNKSRKLIELFGTQKIKSIIVNRAPIESYLKWLLNILSLGRVQKKLKDLHYDSIFHLSLILQLENDKLLVLEKVSVPELTSVKKIPNGEKLQINITRSLDLNELINNAIKVEKDGFWRYNTVELNCQKFAIDVLQGSNLLTNEAYNFIYQDAKSIVNQLGPQFKPFSDILLNIVGRADILLRGSSINSIRQCSIPTSRIF